MCGIAGIYSYSPAAPAVDPEELLRIRDAMLTRGPDGESLWVSPDHRIGLAHRRLSILDLTEAGAQPMFSADRNLIVTFNGEIYNFPSLRRDLEKRGFVFRSRSDTEVLLHLYDLYGTDMVHHLRGMYAFGIWDTKRQSLFCARDPFGIKPFYYSDDGKTFRFASQVKALLAGKNLSVSPDPAGHVGFFLLGYVPSPHTFYREIHDLQAGHWLLVGSRGEKQERTFCSIPQVIKDYSASEKQMPLSTRLAILSDVTRNSVCAHLMSDVPLGVFLSSGYDSTILTAYASREVTTPLQTITLGFSELKNTPFDETILAEETSRRLHTQHQTRWVSLQSFQEELPGIFQAMDQPSIDGVNSYFVSKVAAAAGLKVALSGLGGDELFGSYPSFRHSPASVRLIAKLPVFPGFAHLFRQVSAPFLKHFTSPKFASLLEYGGDPAGAYFLRRSLFMPWELPEFLDGDFVKQGWDSLQLFPHLHQTERSVASPYLKAVSLEMTWYMQQQLLRDTDWASMAHSLEIRVPFVDLEFLKKTIHLFRKSPRPTKDDALSEFAEQIPTKLLTQKKVGFVVPVREWMFQMSDRKTNERGYRGWAKMVHKQFAPGMAKNGAKQ